MKITIEVVPVEQQRKFRGKPIIGDWFFEGDDLTIRMCDLGDWRYNLLYARHEMDEAFLCRHNGISTAEVDAQCNMPDKEDEVSDPDSFSGYHGATYQNQHNDALSAEWIMSRLLGVNWSEYGKAVQKFIDSGGTF